ncbi:uncharacterized protein LOC118645594 [Monomorium pharaonis]|uniref:uncharacterized protein LOC118645594 n=1 Tax=Monomorium pharaonis TaxID=307658 RepID=UPI001747BCF2|nr:uncharacterized protein LOC118645594 [Monomorium pharaonis]
MSKNNDAAIANDSWLHSEQATRAIEYCEQDFIEARDRVRRELDPYDSELPENVVREREFPFANLDASLFQNEFNATRQHRVKRRTRPYESRTPSRVSSRGEFSFTSYESDIFDPAEFFQTNAMPNDRQAETQQFIAGAEQELQNLHQELSANAPRLARTATQRDDVQDIREALRAMMHEVRRLTTEVNEVRETNSRTLRTHAPRQTRYSRRETAFEYPDDDVRRQRGRGILSLKEARGMIPEFDGNASRLQEFLSAMTYAIENIDPSDEVSLLGAILCTKLKGRAMLDFQTRKISDFVQLKTELEACYASKQSTTHLQLDFNTLKQRPGESARAYGLRTDKLTIDLYESMIEGRHQYTAEHKRIILEMLQQQALENYQIGLREDTKAVVRSRGYVTLQDAIAAASTEERIKGPAGSNTRRTPDSPRHYDKSDARCRNCGKYDHYSKDCRNNRSSNRYALPQPDKRINAIDKHCNHCKKRGHTRNECWNFHGRPKAKVTNAQGKMQSAEITGARKKAITQKRNSDSEHSSEEEGATSRTQSATISLIKVKNLKGKTRIYPEEISLVGITGHRVHTIGKMQATIKIGEREIKHAIYVIRDDFPMEYEGIIGLDFLRKQHVSCDYKNKTVTIEDVMQQHLNPEERKALNRICNEYQDIFHLNGEPLTCTSTVKHEISTRADAAPVNVRPYRLPAKHKEEVSTQIKEMLKNSIIRTSTSQWNAPLLVVSKKADSTGKLRLQIVIDFRKLNDLTIGDSFPLPNIDEILDQLGNAKYFTTLDLASGYHQIPMAEHDKPKTAFSTPYGHYEYNRMPFGLKNAPATFQRLMNSVLTGMQGLRCLVYLDDIVIYGSSLKEHNKRLEEVLLRLREANLKLQPDKCEFLQKEVNYLGHIISKDGIAPDPGKLQAIKDFPEPRKVKDIQSFIGLAGYYRKFISDFSKIAKPMTKLIKKTEKFVWTTEQQIAFDTLKEKLMTASVLQYPDFTKEFNVTTDASDYAIGAVLSRGPVGSDRPIAYTSRVLNRAEQNYSTTEKELLAIVWAVKHFRPYVYGVKFKIVTDHKPLT